MAEDYLGRLGRFAISGIHLPYRTISVKGGLRVVTHEYPHVAGGLAEKLGRKLYMINVTLAIDEGISLQGFYQNRNLFTDLGVLMGLFEDQVTVPVYLPHIGEIQAFATEWERGLDVKMRSGEAVTIQLQEDNDAGYLVQQALTVEKSATIGSSMDKLESMAPPEKPDLFKELRAAVNGVIAYRDTAQMYAGFLAAKVEGLLFLLEELDSTIEEFQDPMNHEMLDAFQELWAAVQEIGQTAGLIQEFKTYTLPRDMTAQEVSLAIYGDTEHGVDVINLNALEDPYDIPAGTEVRYFREAS